MNNQTLISVAKVLNRASVENHDKYLEWADHAGAALPESFIQVGLYNALGEKFGDEYKIILETRMVQLGFGGSGRVDIAMFSTDEDSRPECVIEVKKAAQLRHLEKDKNSIELMQQQVHGLKGLLFCHSSRLRRKSLEDFKENLVESFGDKNVISSEIAISFGRSESRGFYQSHCVLFR